MAPHYEEASSPPETPASETPATNGNGPERASTLTPVLAGTRWGAFTVDGDNGFMSPMAQMMLEAAREFTREQAERSRNNASSNGAANGATTTNGASNGGATANGETPNGAPVSDPEASTAPAVQPPPPGTTTGPEGEVKPPAEEEQQQQPEAEPGPPPKLPPAAIIGLSCRLPGEVRTPDDFWQLVCRGRSGWTPIPKDRFSLEGYYHPDANRLGTYNPVGGCFLTEDVAAFDAPFFGITEREAKAMDPQHRIILECVYEALENAGIGRHELVGKKVACYAGGSFTDYELNNLRDLDTAPMYQSTGNAPSLLANRISYFFDFRGPSHTIETACSSSLTALHLAMEALATGDADLVVLASSHLNLLPDHFVSMSSQGLLSGDGRSYAFDKRANGFGRGEGAGVIILKPLDQAIADNDGIRALVVGSGVNQDGRTNGITMPNGEAQLQLMRDVYRDFRLDPRETGFVEAHGTGTKVGDPIEMKALHEMFDEGRSPRRPLYVGSVKTNVGHLEGASGIVSLIKGALMLERGYVLPNHDFVEGNPEIPFDEWNVRVPTKLISWPKGKKYVSINSFGFGGGNAHAVLAAPPKKQVLLNSILPTEYVEPKRLFVLSANSIGSLAQQLTNLVVYLERRPIAFQWDLLANLAYTLGQRRSFLAYKITFASNDGASLIAAMAKARDGLDKTAVRATRQPRLGFVFTGQGAQWHAMGRELLPAYPVFQESLEKFTSALLDLGADFNLLDELKRDAKESRLATAQLSQPACTAVQVALVDLLRNWAVRPHAVVGHSSGEIAAAYAAGALTLEECAAAAYWRGQAVLELKRRHPKLEGAMLAVGASDEEVAEEIATMQKEGILSAKDTGKVVVACINSPGSITASGDEAAVRKLQDRIEEKGMFNRRVRVDTAYHSHHMELVADWYGDKLGALEPRAGPAESAAREIVEKKLKLQKTATENVEGQNEEDKVTAAAKTDSKEGEKAEEATKTEPKEKPQKAEEVLFYSSLQGRHLPTLSSLGTDYWVRNLTQPVQFASALAALCTPENPDDKVDLLVEIGPHSALEGPVKQILKALVDPATGQPVSGKKPTYLSSLVRNKDAVDSMLSLASSLFVQGAMLDFGGINFPVPPPKPLRVLRDMPVYAWDHSTRYWWETRISRGHLYRPFPRNDVLGALADYSNEIEPVWRNIVRPDEIPWVRGHAMQGMIIYPMAGYLSMAIEAAAQKAALKTGGGGSHATGSGREIAKALGINRFIFRDVTINRPLVVPETVEGVETNLALRPFVEGTKNSSRTWDEFRVFSWTKERGWLEHCRGLIRVEMAEGASGAGKAATAPATATNEVHDATATEKAALAARKARIAGSVSEPVSAKDLYEDLEAVTAKYAPTFQSMENCVAGMGSAPLSTSSCTADIVIPDTAELMPKHYEPELVVHPAFLDQFTHAAWVVLGAGRSKDTAASSGDGGKRTTRLPALYMPRWFKSLSVSASVAGRKPGDRLRVYGEGDPDWEHPGSTKVTMFATEAVGDADEELIRMEDLTIEPFLDGADEGAGADGEEAPEKRDLCFKVTWEALSSPDAAPTAEQTQTDAATARPESNGVDEEAAAPAELRFTDPITILCTPSQASTLAASLQKELVAADGEADVAVTTSLADAAKTSAADPNARTFVVLVELASPLLATLSEKDFGSLQTLITTARGILWVVRGATAGGPGADPASGMVIGLARTVRSESGARFATLDLDAAADVSVEPIVDILTRLFAKSKSDDVAAISPSSGTADDMEYRQRDGKLQAARVEAAPELDALIGHLTGASWLSKADAAQPFEQPFQQARRPLKLTLGHRGALDTLHFVTDDAASKEVPLADDEIEIEVRHTSMNFKDVMVAMGEVPSPYLGVECSGFVSRMGARAREANPSIDVGTAVAASTEGAYSTYVRCKATSAARVPGNMSLELAATVPVVFATAYYSLFDVGRLEPGETVLIHAAAGGVGQAALQLVRWRLGDAGMSGVYATVSNKAKKELVMNEYGVPEQNIFYSRDASFAPAVLAATNGRGVDLVLNSLAAEQLRATWTLIAPFGRLIEIGKRDILANTGLEMSVFERGATFASVDLTVVAKDRPRVMKRLLDDVFALMAQGILRPVGPITRFGIGEVERAFRTLQKGAVMGKILVSPAPKDSGEVDMVKATFALQTYEGLLRKDATYLLVGGTGGIGRSMARWMLRQGAGCVVLISRSATVTPKVAELVDEAKALGAQVLVWRCDVADAQDVRSMLDGIKTKGIPDVRGLVHGAMVLDVSDNTLQVFSGFMIPRAATLQFLFCMSAYMVPPPPFFF